MRNKKAIISGGSKGIGRAIAVQLASEGISCAIIGRDEQNLKITQGLIKDQGVECYIIKADLSDIDSLNICISDLMRIDDCWDILVNNAGYAKQTSLLDLPIDEWDFVNNTNTKSALILSKAIAEGMMKNKKGKIINISSLGAFFGTNGMGAYGASKAAMNQLTRTMAVEWGKYNIQVNAICPTVILTDLGRSIWDKPENADLKKSFLNKIPAGRFGEPDDVANLVCFLASERSNFLNGLSIPLDGGKSVMP